MKILLVHQYFNLTKGGFRTYTFARYLVNRGHKVVVVTSNRDNPHWKKFERKTIDGIEIIYIKNYYSNKMRFLRRILSFLRFMYLTIKTVRRINDADLLYATSTPLTVGIPGIFFKRKFNKPFVFEVRDLWPELPVAMGVIKNKWLILFLKYWERKIYFASDHIIALSPGMQEGILQTGYPFKKTTLISNGCDIEILNKDNEQKIIIPGIEPNDLTLIYAGNFGLANGLNYVIDLAKYLQNSGISYIKFILIGDGMKKEYLQNEIKRENLRNVIMFDYMPKDQVKKYIRSADIGMQILTDIPAFYYGTSPNKFFDYISLAKPVFNNYPGWLADLITEYNCGCVVNRNDFESAFIELDKYHQNRKLIKNQGENALKLAIDKFDRNKLAAKLEKIFMNVMEQQR